MFFTLDAPKQGLRCEIIAFLRASGCAAADGGTGRAHRKKMGGKIGQKTREKAVECRVIEAGEEREACAA